MFVLEDLIITVPDFTFNGRLGADPGQQVFRPLSWVGVSGTPEASVRDCPDCIVLCTGLGNLVVEDEGAASGFDTFRIQKADPQCNGGIRSGPPIGFSAVRTVFGADITLEYHWIPADCPVDLTTLSNPALYPQHLYGVPDGIVDREDFFYFLDQAGNIAVADLTGVAIPGLPGYGTPNGVLNNDDFFYFLTLFAAGC